jgi:3-isopropylmalate/(R)-2-methylmalate dehydratase large subunit
LPTLAQKILEEHVGRPVEIGEIVEARVDFVMLNDITGPLTLKVLEEVGTDEPWDPSRVVVVLDHQSPACSVEAAAAHLKLREFSRKWSVKLFEVGEGVCHQVFMERGFAKPGSLVVGADSHTCTYGALGCFGTGIGSTDAAYALLKGRLWFRVPENFRILVHGKLPVGTFAKDLILHIIGKIGSDGATYMAVEFQGETISELGISDRMVLCNMGVEMGAKAALVAPDMKTLEWFRERGMEVPQVSSDPDAEWGREEVFEVSKLEPQVACPPRVDNVKSVGEVEGVEIDQAFLGSCTNGRVEDLLEAARILKGRRVHPGVRMVVSPASREVYLKALELGVIRTLIEAGATVVSPSCAACMGGHVGILGPGEVCISSSNRNFKGRMGSPEAEIYLASPATVAASAVGGKITDPRRYYG